MKNCAYCMKILTVILQDNGKSFCDEFCKFLYEDLRKKRLATEKDKRQQELSLK